MTAIVLFQVNLLRFHAGCVFNIVKDCSKQFKTLNMLFFRAD
ncbi:hypothetical protein D1BOALGB6SA_1243 [Olavius sp. associated proteobacterium Delta 1]|nr:hypothetical protein D1BOALGB6SA_1243 [Olavius sp. associated proteobacterium Delta 1]